MRRNLLVARRTHTHFRPAAAGNLAALSVKGVTVSVMSALRHDYRPEAGMRTASPVASPCADNAAPITSGFWTVKSTSGLFQSRCFRQIRHPSALSMGVCPSRKQGPEEQSHKSLIISVVPGRNDA